MKIKSHEDEKLIRLLVSEIELCAENIGVKDIVLGLSGGCDSAVVAALVARTRLRLHAVLLPTRVSSPLHLRDAYTLLDALAREYEGISYEVISLAPFMEDFEALLGGKEAQSSFHSTSGGGISGGKIESNFHSTNSGDFDGDGIEQDFHSTSSGENRAKQERLDALRLGNFAARLRMSLLYDRSAKHHAIVIGTSNKSERYLGYGTLFGDLASAFNPIGSIYKSDIFALARALNLPKSIYTKEPSADLYEGQSDSDELRYSYDEIDPLLQEIEGLGYSVGMQIPESAKLELKKTMASMMVDEIVDRINANTFKHYMPEVIKLEG